MMMIQHALVMIQENDEEIEGCYVRQKGTGVWKPVMMSRQKSDRIGKVRDDRAGKKKYE